MKQVVVVGAGVAGLAAAIRLRLAGYEVALYEKEPQVGGKMNRIQENGFTFDVGPTIVMMPELYREVFQLAGRDPDDYIPMEQVEPLMEISFGPGERLRLSNNLADLTAALEAVSEEDAQGYFDYLAELYRRFRIAKDNFLQRPFRKPTDFYNPKSLMAGLRLHTLGDAYSSVSRHVSDDRLRKALAFQTLYIGISPYEGPSLYMIIPLIELLYGVWYMPGGMYALAAGLERLFRELGGQLHVGTPVERIEVEKGRAVGVRAGDRLVPADAVVCAADFPYAMKNLVDAPAQGKYTPQKVDAMDYSCSCFVLYLGLDKRYPADAMHSIRFAPDFERNIADIFDDGRFPEDPSFYCYAPTAWDDTLAPEGMQTLYVLVPVPPLAGDGEGSAWGPEEVAACRNHVLDLVERETAYHDVREHIAFERIYTPVEFAERFNAYRGATFGLRPTLLQSNYWRPHNKADACEGLYFCGSSTHPGAGVPIVLLSAKLAAEELMRDDRAEGAAAYATEAQEAVVAARAAATPVAGPAVTRTAAGAVTVGAAAAGAATPRTARAATTRNGEGGRR